MTTISSWYGRLGNNIQQLSNAIYFCEKNKLCFSSPDHNLINPIEVRFGEENASPGRYYYFHKNYGDNPDFLCDEKDLNKQRKKICEKYILPNLKIDTKYKAVSDDTLVIHLRGGDAFFSYPHSHFVQNPLCFYLKIIENYDKVLVVSEGGNPAEDELRKNSKCSIQKSSLNDDFLTLISARNLVSSGYGTFCISAALCSKNLHNFYFTNIYGAECLNPDMLAGSNVKMHLTSINLEKYIKLGEWNASNEQIKLMMEYKCI